MVFRQADQSETEQILSFLYEDIGNCVYPYIDIKDYGFPNETIDVWVEEESGTYISVLMRYLDSFQIYVRDNTPNDDRVNDIVALMQEHQIKRIQGSTETIRQCAEHFGDVADVYYGKVFELLHHRPYKPDVVDIEEASIEDIPEIVDLILSSPEIGKGYDRESTIKAFESRAKTGDGKSWIIRVNNEIAAHVCYSASCDKFVVGAFTVVAEKYQSYPYGMLIDSYFIEVVLPMLKKRGFSFITEKRRIRLFEMLGNPVIGEYGMLKMLH